VTISKQTTDETATGAHGEKRDINKSSCR